MLNRIRLKRENTFKMKIGPIVFLIALAAGRLDAPATPPTRVDRAKWWLDAVKIEKLYMAPRYAGCVLIGVSRGE